MRLNTLPVLKTPSHVQLREHKLCTKIACMAILVPLPWDTPIYLRVILLYLYFLCLWVGVPTPLRNAWMDCELYWRNVDYNLDNPKLLLLWRGAFYCTYSVIVERDYVSVQLTNEGRRLTEELRILRTSCVPWDLTSCTLYLGIQVARIIYTYA